VLQGDGFETEEEDVVELGGDFDGEDAVDDFDQRFGGMDGAGEADSLVDGDLGGVEVVRDEALRGGGAVEEGGEGLAQGGAEGGGFGAAETVRAPENQGGVVVGSGGEEGGEHGKFGPWAHQRKWAQ